MADFCYQCSMDNFGEDLKDLSGLGNGEKLPPESGWATLCEGCGPAVVDDNGVCLAVFCDKQHGKKLTPS